MGNIFILILATIAMLYIAWNLGANDAANPTSTAVGSNAISLRNAVVLFSTFAAVGALVQGYMVMRTIGKGVVNPIDPVGALVAAFSAGIVITLITWRGMPISTTHSIVGAVLGVGLGYMIFNGENRINMSVVYKVIASWIISPLIAMTLAITLYVIFSRLKDYLTVKGYDVDKFFRYLLIGNLAFSAYSYGANDIANATGVFITTTSSILGTPDRTTMYILAFIGSVGITLGAFTWGYRVIETIGYKITRLDYVTGAAAVLSNAITVWSFSTLPKIYFGYGMPISTTHASVSSVMGVGIAKNRGLKGLNLRIIGWILVSWLLTVPAAALMSLGIYTIIKLLLPW
ncbi:MAG: inorganic phosphate transporter [Euryarchaeota archaeon]|nr:inorganic phosphate transporter [Euryarchaeota archaeon]MCD6158552.1 inorganic phosphate transporter [Euryarchaeota archaeon]